MLTLASVLIDLINASLLEHSWVSASVPAPSSRSKFHLMRSSSHIKVASVMAVAVTGLYARYKPHRQEFRRDSRLAVATSKPQKSTSKYQGRIQVGSISQDRRAAITLAIWWDADEPKIHCCSITCGE
jgi:hypothetical protein